MKFLVLALFVAVVSGATTRNPLGGRIDVDVNREDVKDMAKFAYQMISASLNSAHALKMGKVLKAQSQVVSGVMYYLIVEVEETDCDKTVVDMSKCKVVETKRCEAEVLSKPWDPLHKKQFEKYSCVSPLMAATEGTTKSHIGGKTDVDVNREDVKDMAKFAYEKIGASLNTAHALKMGNVLKAQTQVVNGVMYYLTLEVEETDCAKNVVDMSKCKVIKTKKCEAEVLSKPWDTLHKKMLEKSVCTDV